MAAPSSRAGAAFGSSGGHRRLHGEAYRSKKGASQTPRRRSADATSRAENNVRSVYAVNAGRQAYGPSGPRAGATACEVRGAMDPSSTAGAPIPVPLSRIHAALERSSLERAGKLGRPEAATVYNIGQGRTERQVTGVDPVGWAQDFSSGSAVGGSCGSRRTHSADRTSRPVAEVPAARQQEETFDAVAANDRDLEFRPPRPTTPGMGRTAAPMRPPPEPGVSMTHVSNTWNERPEPPPRPSTPCMNRAVPSAGPASGASPPDERTEIPPRPSTPCMNRAMPAPGTSGSFHDDRADLPPRPSTPCMSRTVPPSSTAAGSHKSGTSAPTDRADLPARPSTPCMNRPRPSPGPAGGVGNASMESGFDERPELPPRPSTPCMNRGVPSAVVAATGIACNPSFTSYGDDREELPPRPTTPRMNRSVPSTAGNTNLALEHNDRPDLPARPRTPCMNRSTGRRRTSSAGRSGSRAGSVGAHMSQLERRLLGGRGEADPGTEDSENRDAVPRGDDPRLRRDHRPASGSYSHSYRSPDATDAAGAVARAPASLLEEALAMCKQARTSAQGSSTNSAPTTASSIRAPPFVAVVESCAEVRPAGFEECEQASPQLSPRPGELARPNAPTPEQTSHWLQGLDHPEPGAATFSKADTADTSWVSVRTGRAGQAEQHCVSPDLDEGSGSAEHWQRPRSPTPTKMLAWGEEEDDRSPGPTPREPLGSPSDDEDMFGRGDASDGLINRLIEACQMDDVRRAFRIYDRLRKMRVTLYEGVYKLIIECCMRTQQLGHAIQFYEMLRSSGQRVSSRLVVVLIEACAREQHSDKVHALWQGWCLASEPLGSCHREVLLTTVSALLRTLSPDLALEVLSDAMQRSGGALASCLGDIEAEVEDLLQLVESSASEAQLNGAGQLGDGLIASYRGLEALLLQILDEVAAGRESTAMTAGFDSLSPEVVLSAADNTASAESVGPACSRQVWQADDELLLMEDVDVDLDIELHA
eukprot:TRINITY_DN106488_c0_g1_i1.p1 TRINITY_DN106488_c0_g1~~TRINITY_DN106488_c0_g1_i1.p1  ORF type:complete len:989 (+),score=146.00 TRINITY_DN106488_c0_g1_i1:29-2995(+)